MIKTPKELMDLIDFRFSNGKISDATIFIQDFSSRINERLWISSPYVSNEKVFLNLFNIGTIKKRKVDFKLLTNIKNISINNQNILEFFIQNGELRTLDNLHSKMYFMDKYSLITSANLTKRGFYYNYETFVALYEEQNCETLFNDLWNNAQQVTFNNLNDYIEQNKETYYTDFDSDLPLEPVRQLPKFLTRATKYEKFLQVFHNLEEKYSSYGRVWKNSPLKYEIDCFLDYLFHASVNNKSTKYYQNNDYNRAADDELLKICIAEFKNWIQTSNDAQKEQRRLNFESKIKNLLSRRGNSNLKEIYDCFFECLNTYQSQAVHWHWEELFMAKNTPEKVFEYLDLLQNVEIKNVDKLISNPPIKPFGQWSAQELLGLLREEFPIRNENTNAGLRYLGYDV